MQADRPTAIPGTPSVPQLPEIPDHKLLRLIGRGAYGEVWLARNAIGTLRAVKIVHRQSFQRAEHFEREFKGLLKFEPISRSHDGLVDVLQIGRRDDAGCFYYVMELADDASGEKEKRGAGEKENCPSAPSPLFSSAEYEPKTLRSELHARGSLLPAECVAIGLKLASALEHLHANGLVHRDIKPSNIIFVNGEPKLADIGLVTAIDEAQSLVGTVGYIPPEGPGTPQADLYSLGKVLYEIALGKDRQEFPQLPPDLQSHPDYAALLELNEVILKACETDSRQRYQSAEGMLIDLRLLESGSSVKHHRARQEQISVAWRVVRAAAVVVAIAAGGIFLWQTVTRQSAPAIVPSNDRAAKAFKLGYEQLRLGTSNGFHQATAAFTDAIKADPGYTAAYAGLFEANLMAESDGTLPIGGTSEKLNDSLAALVKIAPTNAETHAARAIVLWLNERKRSEAEKEFNQAMQADPGSRMALTCYGRFLTQLGRNDVAHPVLERALALDSTSPLIMRLLGECESGRTSAPNRDSSPSLTAPTSPK